VYVCIYVYQGCFRTIVKGKRTIGIINKEVNFIGHRSILNDEYFEPIKNKIRERIFFFSIELRNMVILAIDLYIFRTMNQLIIEINYCFFFFFFFLLIQSMAFRIIKYLNFNVKSMQNINLHPTRNILCYYDLFT